MKRPEFYNTIQSTGQQLIDFTEAAKTSKLAVLEVFCEFKEQSFTPFEIHAILTKKGYKYPITSIRRAITNLTDINELVMNDKSQQQIGNYGVPNNTWKFNKYRNNPHQSTSTESQTSAQEIPEH